MTRRPSWWDKDVHADRRPFLIARGKIRDALRGYFASEGFLEVECGALQVSPGNETHLHAFATERIEPDETRRRLHLHTSPEFACKKLLAAGEKKIFSLGPVFRNRERGDLNAPEFTMLEWYRADETYEAVIRDCLAIIRLAARTADSGVFSFRGRTADPFAVARRVSVNEAFRVFGQIDLMKTVSADGTPNGDSLARQATGAGIKVAPNDTWADIFSRVLTERVEPELGIACPTILDEYPRALAALARPAAHDPRVAERFEIYLCGVELANGFGELTDAVEQRRRFEAEMAEKERIYGESYPIDEDFLSALSMMPEASGVALGFDRLVMLATHAERVGRVMWTPLEN